MVTAFPACSPLVWSEKEMPSSLRLRVELPTVAPAKVVTGLVVWVAAPARLMRTTDSRPTRARATKDSSFHDAPHGSGPDTKPGVWPNRPCHAKLG
jgi:hypothetical protein